MTEFGAEYVIFLAQNLFSGAALAIVLIKIIEDRRRSRAKGQKKAGVSC